MKCDLNFQFSVLTALRALETWDAFLHSALTTLAFSDPQGAT